MSVTAPQFKFEMISDGKHVTDGKTLKKGDIVKTHKDLASAFPDRFQLYEERRHRDEPEEVTTLKIKPKGSGKAKAADETSLEARGDDVTAKFPKVDAKLLRVYKRDSLYHVYEKDSATPLNKKGLDKGDVSKFAKDYLDE